MFDPRLDVPLGRSLNRVTHYRFEPSAERIEDEMIFD
jgi:hypothetical protein